MNRIRTRLIAVFLAATLVPAAVTWWVATALLEHSASLSSPDELDRLSKTLEHTGRALYQHVRESLKQDADAGRIKPEVFSPPGAAWPQDVRDFAAGGEPERFALSAGGASISYFVRRGAAVWRYGRPFHGVSMSDVQAEYRRARESVATARGRDLRTGLVRAFAVIAAAAWGVALVALFFLAHRISRPIQQLTAGLARLAGGDLSTRIPGAGNDEAGRAIQAFNETAAQLEGSRERLVYLTQLASWRQLARKMAHELKNSLTPVRLTMEEVLARGAAEDPRFAEQAARIVMDEVESLERRVRAFSEFSAEPPVRPMTLDLNRLVEERIALLGAGHPDVRYMKRLAGRAPLARADEDLVKGILTNLLENAADAAGAGGSILIATGEADGRAVVEVHDSGPGLSQQARESLFEPTISFKKRGMGLGLSIVRKNALLTGGDVELIGGDLGGAAFRITLPAAG